MTFEDLVPDWDTKPIADPQVAADVVDLFLHIRDRFANTLLLLPCSAESVPTKNVVLVDDVPWLCDEDQRREAIRGLLSGLPPGSAFIFATSHPTEEVTLSDRRWARDVRDAAAKIGLRVTGCFTATPDAVHAA